MADARSLLREERARRGHASTAKPGTKKRKAEDIDSPQAADERKKTRPEQQHNEDVTNDVRLMETSLEPRHIVPREGLITAEQVEVGTKALESGKKLDHLTPPGSPDETLSTRRVTPSQKTQTEKEKDISAHEMAAFEAELIAMDAQNSRTNTNIAAAAQATISAKPMTAEDVARQAREEQSRQRREREGEEEDERDDAARVLEREFEEMEGLEERVRVLRERRERLRRTGSEGGEGGGGGGDRQDSVGVQGGNKEDAGAGGEEDEEEEDDDDDEEDDFFARR